MISAPASDEAIRQVLNLKYGPADRQGWGPRLRERFGYRTPDDWYEALVFDLVAPGTVWLDVGGGWSPFPYNPAMAGLLAQRCRRLVGIDPSTNIHDNKFLHDRAQCLLQDFRTDERFDLITARMVVEHIDDPVTAVAALARLAKPGGLVVIYTVEKLSPVTFLSAVTPIGFHHAVKKLLWEAEERDTFPTVYKMNSRRQLRMLFEAAGFRETSFRHLDDCRAFGRWRSLNAMELVARRGFNAVGLRYPDACILATYRREG